MYFVEIKEDKFEKAYENVEKALKYMGKVMQCFSEWEEESMMGERSMNSGTRNYGNRNGYGMRNNMGYRDEDEWEDYEMGERRGSRGSRRRM